MDPAKVGKLIKLTKKIMDHNISQCFMSEYYKDRYLELKNLIYLKKIFRKLRNNEYRKVKDWVYDLKNITKLSEINQDVSNDKKEAIKNTKIEFNKIIDSTINRAFDNSGSPGWKEKLMDRNKKIVKMINNSPVKGKHIFDVKYKTKPNIQSFTREEIRDMYIKLNKAPLKAREKAIDIIKEVEPSYFRNNENRKIDFGCLKPETISKIKSYLDDPKYISNINSSVKSHNFLKTTSQTIIKSVNGSSSGGIFGGISSTNGKCGLRNLGNTCYFNSGIQCLMHSMPLVRFLLSNEWKQQVNDENPLGTRGRLVRDFSALLTKFWTGQSDVLDPCDLRSTIVCFAPHFSGYEQHDSHELIMYMLDAIHEDLNRCIRKPMIETIIGDGSNDYEIAEKAWKNHKKRNDSIIVDYFHGQLRSRCFCPKCENNIVVFDPFAVLSIPISPPVKRNVDVLYMPFDIFSRHEWIRITVSKCASTKEYRKALRKKVKGRFIVGFKSTIDDLVYDVKYSGQSEYLKPICFEIPFEEGETEKILIPIQLSVKTIYKYVQVMECFFIQARKDISRSLLMKKIIKKVRCFWNDSNQPEREIDNELKDWISSVKSSLSPFTYTDDRIEVRFFDSFVPHYKYNFIHYKVVTAIIGKNYLERENGALLNNIFYYALNDNRSRNIGSKIALYDCLEFFTSEEKLTEENKWYCPHCKEFVCANKKIDIWKLPTCLVIQLKRFETSEIGSNKDDKLVDFPSTLDLSNYIANSSDKAEYKLYAVSEHYGSLDNGHYTAKALVSNSKERVWYSFDDQSARPVDESKVHSNSAYVIFYEKVSSFFMDD